MSAYVDQDLCISCGFCVGNAPEVFQFDDTGKAEAIAETTEENKDVVHECAEGCPVDAIKEG